jgi:hypothetical protein
MRKLFAIVLVICMLFPSGCTERAKPQQPQGLMWTVRTAQEMCLNYSRNLLNDYELVTAIDTNSATGRGCGWEGSSKGKSNVWAFQFVVIGKLNNSYSSLFLQGEICEKNGKANYSGFGIFESPIPENEVNDTLLYVSENNITKSIRIFDSPEIYKTAVEKRGSLPENAYVHGVYMNLQNVGIAGSPTWIVKWDYLAKKGITPGMYSPTIYVNGLTANAIK